MRKARLLAVNFGLGWLLLTRIALAQTSHQPSGSSEQPTSSSAPQVAPVPLAPQQQARASVEQPYQQPGEPVDSAPQSPATLGAASPTDNAEPPACHLPPKRVERSSYNHDGFFLRFVHGFGAGWMSYRIGQTELFSAHGVVYQFSMQIGRTLTPGFVLGAGMSGERIIDPAFEGNNQIFALNSNATWVAGLDTMAYYYPNPKAGLNIHAQFGF